MTAAKTSSDTERCIVAAALGGKSGKAIAAAFGISRRWVSNILHRNGIKPTIGRRPSCDLNHAAFDQITREGAYWIGYLIADGCLKVDDSGAPQLILDIAEKDRTHVEKLRSFLGSSHAIITVTHKAGTIGSTAVKARRSVAFRVRSKRIVAALVSHGMGIKKGPDRAPKSDALLYSPDFWRGVVDGDGTVDCYKDSHGYTYACLILCGHRPLLEKYQMFLLRHGLIANITDTSSGIFQVRMMGLGALAMIRLLYEDAPVVLDRKLDSARRAIENGK